MNISTKSNSFFLCILQIWLFAGAATAFAPVPSGAFSLQTSGIFRKHSSTALHETDNMGSSDSADVATSEQEVSPAISTDDDKEQHQPTLKHRVLRILPSSDEIQMASSVFVGCVLTFALNNYGIAVGPIKASSVVGMVAALCFPTDKLALAAFCGSFAGMAREAVIPGMYVSCSLGLVCAIMMAIFDRKKWLVGVGGRLGFIAQLACTLQFFMGRLPFLSLPKNAAARLVGTYPSGTVLLSQLVPTIFFTAVGALLMSAWKEALTSLSKKQQKAGDVGDVASFLLNRLSTSVAAVSATGLIMSLFPVSAAGPAFCGSFIAMSSPEKIQTYGGLMGASLMGGASQIGMAGVMLGGWGGKLGTASLLGVWGYRKLMVFVTTYFQTLREQRTTTTTYSYADGGATKQL